MSTQEISEEATRHIAHLARLALTDDEVKIFSVQLSAVLKHGADIDSINVDDVAPTMHAISLKNVMREDIVEASLERDDVLISAPQVQDGMFVVPRILGES